MTSSIKRELTNKELLSKYKKHHLDIIKSVEQGLKLKELPYLPNEVVLEIVNNLPSEKKFLVLDHIEKPELKPFILRKDSVLRKRLVSYLIDNLKGKYRNKPYLLFKKYIDMNIFTIKDFKEKLSEIMITGDVEMMEYLMSLGLTKKRLLEEEQMGQIFLASIWRKNLQMMKFLIEQGVPLSKNYIIYGVETGDLQIIKVLMSKKGLTINKLRDVWILPDILNAIAEKGYVDIMKYFMSLGVTLNDLENKKVLERAVMYNQYNLVKYLVSIGMKTYAINNRKGLLKLASNSSSKKIYKYINQL